MDKLPAVAWLVADRFVDVTRLDYAPTGDENTPLVLKSDALSALAQKDARIKELREALAPLLAALDDDCRDTARWDRLMGSARAALSKED